MQSRPNHGYCSPQHLTFEQWVNERLCLLENQFRAVRPGLPPVDPIDPTTPTFGLLALYQTWLLTHPGGSEVEFLAEITDVEVADVTVDFMADLLGPNTGGDDLDEDVDVGNPAVDFLADLLGGLGGTFPDDDDLGGDLDVGDLDLDFEKAFLIGAGITAP